MKIPFTASARTAMLIGSENFSNPLCCYILNQI